MPETKPPAPPRKFIIEFNREGCIGAAACEAANPKFWKLREDGKSDLLGGVKNADNTLQTREIDEADFKANMEAAQACPVNVIHLKRKETGERLI